MPPVNPSGKNQRFLPAPTGREPCGQCPLTISHGSFLRIVLSLTRPVSLLRCSRCLGQSPPCQRGVPRQRRGGGIKGWQVSTWVCAFEKVPTVNPSVTAAPCQLPLAREPLGAVSLLCRRVPQIAPDCGEPFLCLPGEGKTNVSTINTGIIHTISKKSGEIPTYLSYLPEGL